MSVDRGRLMDHSYDGIQEYDNPTPAWWHMIFIATILFSVVYLIHYEFDPHTPTIQERHAAAEVAELKRLFADVGQLEPDEATLVTLVDEEKWSRVGSGIFAGNCASCHGSKGEGLVGPNLTDEFYKNVKTVTDVHTVIVEGAANGAMPAWQNRLHPNEAVLVASYVVSLRGQNLAGRAPEGERIEPWPEIEAPEDDEPEEATGS